MSLKLAPPREEVNDHEIIANNIDRESSMAEELPEAQSVQVSCDREPELEPELRPELIPEGCRNAAEDGTEVVQR